MGIEQLENRISSRDEVCEGVTEGFVLQDSACSREEILRVAAHHQFTTADIKVKGTKLLRKIPGSVRLFRVQFSESNAQVGVRRQGVAALDLGCLKTCGILASWSKTLLHF